MIWNDKPLVLEPVAWWQRFGELTATAGITAFELAQAAIVLAVEEVHDEIGRRLGVPFQDFVKAFPPVMKHGSAA